MASVSEDKSIALWSTFDVNNIMKISTLNDYHSRAIYSCSFNYDGRLLATVYFFFLYIYYLYYFIIINDYLAIFFFL